MIARFFIDRPIFATVLSVVITLIGGIALSTWKYEQCNPADQCDDHGEHGSKMGQSMKNRAIVATRPSPLESLALAGTPGGAPGAA